MGDKKFLVLDVDETLLNIEPLFFLKRFRKNYHEYHGHTIFDKYYISARPNAIEFLKRAKENFELIAFSVVDKGVTKEKLEKLGMLNYFSKIYGKESLIKGKKVLTAIANDLCTDTKDMIIIDDKPNFIEEQENVIEVSPWFIGNNKEDNELMKIHDQLLKLNFTKIGSCL